MSKRREQVNALSVTVSGDARRSRSRQNPAVDQVRESDLIFRALMQCLDFYRAFLAKRLPARIRRRIDLSKLRVLKTSRIGRGLDERIVDCVFVVPLKTGDGFFLIHVEHWSRSRKDAVEIVLDYQIQLLKEARRQYPGQKIFIHTLVVHNGRTPFRHDTDMFPRVTVAERRTAHQSLGSFDLVDLSRLSDEELGGRSLLLRAGETLLKHGYDKRITPTVRRLMPLLRKLWQRSETQEAVHQLMTYAWLAAHEEEKSRIMELAREELNFEEKENAMRVAGVLLRESRQQGLQEGLEKGLETGLQKGRREGRQESLLEVARNMLSNKISVATIAKVTRLSPYRIGKLKLQSF
ncbi:MAG: Rpn family recombination-promoting nuclease/putative transposase [Myxococcota bacterium]